MRFDLKIAGRDVCVRLERLDDGFVAAWVDERRIEASFAAVTKNVLYLTAGPGSQKVCLERTPEGTYVNVKGATWLVRDAHAADAGRPRRKGGAPLQREVTPPMPSVVVSVLVEEGQEVEQGQGVVVVSAMKMETTLYAPYAGVVKKIRCSAGEKVMPGTVLVEIERTGQEQER